MNEPPYDHAADALLEQAVRAMREDLPDDARMQRLQQRLAPVVVATSPSKRWWERRDVQILAGITVRGNLHVPASMDDSPAAVTRVPSRSVPEEQALPPAAAPPSIESGETTPTMPTMAVNALPSAAVAKPGPIEARPRRADPTGITADERPDALEDAGDELALLEQARKALATDPSRTLALADEHVKRFRTPALAQERERLAIDALVRLGRRSEAEARARSFESTYPSSAHLTRVRDLVAPPAGR